VSLLIVVSATRSSAESEQLPKPDPDTEIARRHSEAATHFYDAGRYSEAIAEFEAARRAKPMAALDFNIGRCHDRLEHVSEAMAAYERFIRAEPNDPNAAEVRQRIETLRARVSATSLPTPAPREHPRRRRIATWVVGGVGVGLLVGSLAAGLVANSRHSDLQSSCASNGACDATQVPNAQSWIDSGKSAAIASDTLLGLGLAAVAAGVVLFFVEGRHPIERHTRVVPSAGGLAFAWGTP
jgi:tetratricopeptide (TPR) repeat protein